MSIRNYYILFRRVFALPLATCLAVGVLGEPSCHGAVADISRKPFRYRGGPKRLQMDHPEDWRF